MKMKGLQDSNFRFFKCETSGKHVIKLDSSKNLILCEQVFRKDILWNKIIGFKKLPSMKLFTKAQILGVDSIIVIYFKKKNSDIYENNLFGSVLLNKIINGEIWITTENKKKISKYRILNLLYLRQNNPCPTCVPKPKSELMGLDSLFHDGKMTNYELRHFCKVLQTYYDIIVEINIINVDVYSRCLSYLTNKKIILKKKYEFKSKNRDDENDLLLEFYQKFDVFSCINCAFYKLNKTLESETEVFLQLRLRYYPQLLKDVI